MRNLAFRAFSLKQTFSIDIIYFGQKVKSWIGLDGRPARRIEELELKTATAHLGLRLCLEKNKFIIFYFLKPSQIIKSIFFLKIYGPLYIIDMQMWANSQTETIKKLIAENM